MRSPNSEQKKAIEHEGGVLLSAGAGSGKTFVLVEHVIYLIDNFFNKYKDINNEDLERNLKNYLSKIVLMTFTKKAAGELSLRLNERIELQIENSTDTKWEIAKKVLSAMNVSTIHGFCFKLLGQGFFPTIDPNIKVLNEFETRSRVENLFNFWLETQANEKYFDLILSNNKELLNSLNSIFGSPDLRVQWEEFNVGNWDENYFHELLQDLYINLDLGHLRRSFDLSIWDDYSDKKWFLFLKAYNNLLATNNNKFNVEFLEGLNSLFIEYKGTRGPTAKQGVTTANEALDDLKILRAFITKNKDDFDAFIEHRDNDFLLWPTIFKKAFNYININYNTSSGLTFSDLEYFVLKGLEDKKIIDNINETYSYFIVDEFQDTSVIQYEIINRITKNDPTKIFCVGDLKQAIYGFRGGEIAVFQKCSSQVPQNLTMSNNYRSKENIIYYNNFLFENIFKKGIGYKGRDRFAVDVVYQNSPLDDENKGALYKIDAVISSENDDKLSSSEINYLESESIINQIKNLQIKTSNESICILYKKLAPTKFLIPLLIDNDLSFTAQVKIPIGEDPLIGVLHVLLEGYLTEFKNEEQKTRYTEVLVSTYLEYLGIPTQEITKSIKLFFNDIVILGLEESYKKFLFSSGVANSNFINNMNLITSLCQMESNSIEGVWSKIKTHMDKSYSIDFQYGDNPSEVIIMTAHASKGLEFDHVILGGVHTNGRARPNVDYFGKLPLSFRWKNDSRKKTAYKSPWFILENEINKRKDFAESKRLFYVACTRAVKSLSWVELNYQGKSVQSSAKDSWIYGIRSWEEEFSNKAIDIFEEIKMNNISQEIIKNDDETFLKSLSNTAPLFHKDGLGISSKLSDSAQSIGPIPDLSVTRLASLVDCPRKFYLQNICKFDDSELEVMGVLKESYGSDYKSKLEADSLEDEIQITSSAERGTEIHFILSQMIKRNWVIPRYVKDKNDIDVIQWVISKLKTYRESSTFISEEQIKFPIFGHMVAGIPDLIIKNNLTNAIEIWDFKTGKRDSKKEDNYWFQLNCYGYALYLLGMADKNTSIKLILAYLDNKELVELDSTLNSSRDHIHRHWKKLTNLFEINAEHCSSCSFGNLCHPNGQ